GVGIERRTVAQLSVEVGAPGQHLAARGQRQAVPATPGDGGDGGPGGQVDLNRCAAVGDRAVAQRSVVVGAPRQHLPAGGQSQAVVVAAGDRGDRGPGRQADGNRGVAVGGSAFAQLAVAVITPGQHLSIGGQREAVATAPGDGGDGYSRGQADRHRSGAVEDGGAVPQFAV